MSGSDPSVRTGGATGPADAPCPEGFQTVLGSPVPEVVDQLNPGDLLLLEKIDDPIRGVVAITLDGAIVGAITKDIVRLRRCLDEGAEYEAEVVRISGGSVVVDVAKR